MKVDFTKVILRDIAGKPIKAQSNLHKTVADCIHFTCRTVDLIGVAKIVNEGQEVDLTVSQVKQIKNLVTHPEAPLAGFAKVAVGKYLDIRLKSADGSKKKKKKK